MFKGCICGGNGWGPASELSAIVRTYNPIRTISGDFGGVLEVIHSWKLTWTPKRGPIKITVTQKWDYMGFHVSLGSVTIMKLGYRGS